MMKYVINIYLDIRCIELSRGSPSEEAGRKSLRARGVICRHHPHRRRRQSTLWVGRRLWAKTSLRTASRSTTSHTSDLKLACHIEMIASAQGGGQLIPSRGALSRSLRYFSVLHLMADSWLNRYIPSRGEPLVSMFVQSSGSTGISHPEENRLSMFSYQFLNL